MSQTKSKVIIVVLTLLVFVSQVTTASILSCQMDMQENSTMTMMDHSSHMMGEQLNEVAEPSSNDCCAENSGCSMSGCLSLALPTLFQATNTSFASEAIEHRTQYAISRFLTSLYRPPILG